MASMTVALESEIISTKYDNRTRRCYYTIQRDGKCWTVSLSLDEMNKFKGANHKHLRRTHVATALKNAMNGKPDAA